MQFRRSTLLLVVALLGCESATEVQISTESATVPAGLRLEVAVEPEEMLPGDTARIEVRLTNDRPGPLTIRFGSTCQLAFQVENAAGEPVYPRGWACGLGFTQIDLASGETREAQFSWTGDRSRYPQEGREPFPAGEYRVFGVLGAQAELRSEPTTLVLLQR